MRFRRRTTCAMGAPNRSNWRCGSRCGPRLSDAGAACLHLPNVPADHRLRCARHGRIQPELAQLPDRTQEAVFIARQHPAIEIDPIVRDDGRAIEQNARGARAVEKQSLDIQRAFQTARRLGPPPEPPPLAFHIDECPIAGRVASGQLSQRPGRGRDQPRRAKRAPARGRHYRAAPGRARSAGHRADSSNGTHGATNSKHRSSASCRTHLRLDVLSDLRVRRLDHSGPAK